MLQNQKQTKEIYSMGDPTVSRRIKKSFVPYEFALDSSEPCLIDKDSKQSSDFNRTILEHEQNMWFLITHFEYLNKQAYEVLIKIIWNLNQNIAFQKLHRVKKDSPYYHLKFRLIRYVGCHGAKADHLYLVSKIDIKTSMDDFEKENEYDHKVIKSNRFDACKRCGSLNTLFKINEESKNTYCGGCLGLPGASKRSL